MSPCVGSAGEADIGCTLSRMNLHSEVPQKIHGGARSVDHTKENQNTISRSETAKVEEQKLVTKTMSATPGETETPGNRLKRRGQFLVFVRILLKYLEETADHALTVKVKHIIKDCTCKHREGDPSYVSLVDAVESRLRLVVGERRWRFIEAYIQSYMEKRRRNVVSAIVGKGPQSKTTMAASVA